ncbi:SAV_6107 family HEPN domain-containing protein [Phytoactinopolyspora endophytica]|uniref:SAV_6107 family HEPN domain-containing protein n=1 Tax=Phytoactinopolyspora endophytica TaxID=1642495 RepID=UPI00197B1722|nr:SAV_6107 family HEPN domain-containing protein [Phytoactinopolyspora endophytica]
MNTRYGQLNSVRTVRSDAVRKVRPPMGHATLDLVDQARSCLAEAATARTANERFAAAHLGALRAAAAVLAARAHPVSRRSRSGGGRRRGHGPRNVWELLPTVAPEMTEWAEFFSANAGKRAAAQAGLRGAATAREADDLVRDADAFLAVVCVLLGLPYQEPIDGFASSL